MTGYQGPRPRANCAVCGRLAQLRTMDGRGAYRLKVPVLARHQRQGQDRTRAQCEGSGRPPLID